MARRRHVLKHPVLIHATHKNEASTHGEGSVGGVPFTFFVDDTGIRLTTPEQSRNGRFALARAQSFLQSTLFAEGH
jgi:hypothetical protein